MPIGYPPSSTSSMSPMASTNVHNVGNPYFSSGYMTGSSFSTSNQQNSSVKHYRPWGAELAY
jgi:hypothetical protein